MPTRIREDTLLSVINTHKHLLDAIAEGKTIQYFSGYDGWEDLAVTDFRDHPKHYRVKTEPKVIKVVKEVWSAPVPARTFCSDTASALGHYLCDIDRSNVDFKRYKMEFTLTEILED